MKMPAMILLLMPIVSIAQNFQGMSEADMQKMMQEMQSCMQNVDQNELNALEQRSNQFEAKMKSLCASGKRDEAQARAITFGTEIMNDPTITALRKCGEIMQGMMPMMPFMKQDKDFSNHHVCDESATN